MASKDIKTVAAALDSLHFAIADLLVRDPDPEWVSVRDHFRNLEGRFQYLLALRYLDEKLHTRQPVTLSTQNAVYARDGHQCRYCGTTEAPFHLDHVLPVIQGGTSEPGNLVVACQSCNCRKSVYTPEEAGMPLLPVPAEPLPRSVLKSTADGGPWQVEKKFDPSDFDIDWPEDEFKVDA